MVGCVYPPTKKGQAAKKRNLAATKTTSARFTHVDFGAELAVVCVVRLWSSARLFPSWELLLPYPLLTSLPPSSSSALYEAVKLFYIMSTPHNNPHPFLQISLVIMKIVLCCGSARQRLAIEWPLCGRGVGYGAFKGVCFREQEKGDEWLLAGDCSTSCWIGVVSSVTGVEVSNVRCNYDKRPGS